MLCQWSVWEADGLAAEYGVGGHAVLVGEALLRRPHPEVELLAEVLPVPDGRPQVPHPLVVQRHQDGRPPVRVHLQIAKGWPVLFSCVLFFRNDQNSEIFAEKSDDVQFSFINVRGSE